MRPTTGPLRLVAAYGLEPAMPGPTSGLLSNADFEALVDDAVTEHVTGHLVAAMSDARIVATDAQKSAALDAHHRALAFDLVLERLLVNTSELLDAHGVPHRVLKGPAFAHTVYPAPHLRSFGDIDILVESEKYDAAVALLTARGAWKRFAEPRPGFTRRFGKGVCVTDGDLEIDVHRTFVSGPFGIALDADDLFRSPQSFTIAGKSLTALAPEDQFLHACYHVALGSHTPRLVPMRDVAQMLLTLPLDEEMVLRTARRWRARAVLQRAVQCTWSAFGLVPEHRLVQWASSYQPDQFERRALAAYVAPDRSYAKQALAGIRAVPGLRAQAAYATALLFPSTAYARERHGYVARWRRAAALVRQERPPS